MALVMWVPRGGEAQTSQVALGTSWCPFPARKGPGRGSRSCPGGAGSEGKEKVCTDVLSAERPAPRHRKPLALVPPWMGEGTGPVQGLSTPRSVLRALGTQGSAVTLLPGRVGSCTQLSPSIPQHRKHGGPQLEVRVALCREGAAAPSAPAPRGWGRD